MSKADTIQQLIEYVQTVKPFHSKIYEVATNHTYGEECKIAIKEEMQFTITPDLRDWTVYEGIGWDTTPYALAQYVDTGQVDARGNPIYAVVGDPLNVAFDAEHQHIVTP